MKKTKELFIDMHAGVAGDMLFAALLDFERDSAQREKILAEICRELTALIATTQKPKTAATDKTPLTHDKKSSPHSKKPATTDTEANITVTVKEVSKQGIRGLHVRFDTPEDDWFVAGEYQGQPHGHDHDHDHTHDHSNNNSLPHDHVQPHNHDHKNSPSHDHKHNHSHDHEQPHNHSHNHNHSHDHGNNNSPSHTHAHSHAHTHRRFRDIKAMLKSSTLSAPVKTRAEAVFEIIAEAEATVHNQSVEDVHFHEVGSLDAICEIVGCCLLLEKYEIDVVRAGPLVIGNGTVRCAHGLMPVPVPAVSEMIARAHMPIQKIASSPPTGELTTPTGAALVIALTRMGREKETQKTMRVEDANFNNKNILRNGWGAGTKNLKDLPNVVRVFLLTPSSTSTSTPSVHPYTDTYEEGYEYDEIIEIQSSLDDVTGENLSILMETLLAKGALDVHFQQIVMKKSRPGIIVSILCHPDKRKELGLILLSHSPAIGYRYQTLKRTMLARHQESVTIDNVEIAVKVSITSKGKTRVKAEDESLRKALVKLPYSYGELVYRVKKSYYQDNYMNPHP